MTNLFSFFCESRLHLIIFRSEHELNKKIIQNVNFKFSELRFLKTVELKIIEACNIVWENKNRKHFLKSFWLLFSLCSKKKQTWAHFLARSQQFKLKI